MSGIGFDIGQFMGLAGEEFTVIRGGTEIRDLRGVRNSEQEPHREYVGFYPDADVQEGDVLRSKVSQELLHVVEAKPDVVAGRLFQRKAYYLTEKELKRQSQSQQPSTIYNIGTATGSIIGNQQVAALNLSESPQAIRQLISESDSMDKEELYQLVEQLTAVLEGTQQAKRGVLGRFSEVIQRNAWITGPLATLALNWLLQVK